MQSFSVARLPEYIRCMTRFFGAAIVFSPLLICCCVDYSLFFAFVPSSSAPIRERMQQRISHYLRPTSPPDSARAQSFAAQREMSCFVEAKWFECMAGYVHEVFISYLVV